MSKNLINYQVTPKELALVAECTVSHGDVPFQLEGFPFQWISPGSFPMGNLWHQSSDWDLKGQSDELPIRCLHLEGFWIAQDLISMNDLLANWSSLQHFGCSEFLGAWQDQKYQLLKREFKEHKLPELPAYLINWFEAKCFAQWWTENLMPKVLREEWVADLPTEAEWEKAASWSVVKDTGYERGHKYPFNLGGSEFSKGTIAHINGIKQYPEALMILEEGVNRLRGMSGNLWEWCRDWYQRDFYEQSPTGVECKEAPDNNLSQRRVLRGGCWLNTIRRVRTCNRLGEIPTLNSHKIGFRLVLRRRKVAL